MRKLYEIFNDKKLTPLVSKLTWSHYLQLLSIKDINEITFYINLSINQNLSKRELQEKIKNKEYDRLDDETKRKLIIQESIQINDHIKNPILIRNNSDYDVISEKTLKKIILENLDAFLKELGSNFCYIQNEYKIKIGERYNYIDLLLYNIVYNCYVVVELKVTELKKEHIGQIEIYMNYIDKNLKRIDQDKTIGIIICKKDNQFVMEYCSDKRILSRQYEIIP